MVTGAAGEVVVLTIPAAAAAAEEVRMTAVVKVDEGAGEILTLVLAKLAPG